MTSAENPHPPAVRFDPDSTPLARRTGAAHETESELQTKVIEIAHAFGWRVAHFRAARTQYGWRTPVQADGAGFPDLVLVHRGAHPGAGRVLFRELKGAGRLRISADQAAWLDDLDAGGADVALWRPADWSSIVDVLSFGKASG